MVHQEWQRRFRDHHRGGLGVELHVESSLFRTSLCQTHAQRLSFCALTKPSRPDRLQGVGAALVPGAWRRMMGCSTAVMIAAAHLGIPLRRYGRTLLRLEGVMN